MIFVVEDLVILLYRAIFKQVTTNAQVKKQVNATVRYAVGSLCLNLICRMLIVTHIAEHGILYGIPCFKDNMVNIGVILDSELSLSDQVGRLSQSCFYQLRQLCQIRRTLTDKAAMTLVNAFIVSLVDYCNAVYSG